jgi:hypothetical protein
LSLPDVRDGIDSLFERVDGGAISAAHGDEYQSFEGQAECVGVEVCMVTADCPERSKARSRRWQGERLRPTRSASSVRVKRPSCWSSARICRSTGSIFMILPQSHVASRIFGNMFGGF